MGGARSDPMMAPDLASLALRARIWLARRGGFACAGALLCAAGAGAWLWHLQGEPARQAQLRELARPPAGASAPAVLAPPSADQNLSDFYAALGERRYAEQQVKTLFGLAAKNGLTLSAGQYKEGYDAEGRLYSYQVVLPVKGPYRAVWQFALQTLGAVPFGALDEISFKRDNIGDNMPEARLRFTFYLTDAERP